MYYAQINEDNIVVGVHCTDTPLPEWIECDGYDVMGKIYDPESGTFIDNPHPAPEPDPERTPEEILNQVLVNSEYLVALSEMEG